jgi:hypothetical protein
MIKLEEKENILSLGLIIFGRLMGMISSLRTGLRYMLLLMLILVVLFGFMLEFRIVRLCQLFVSFFK